MWWPPKWALVKELFKQAWPAVILLALAVAVFVAAALQVRGCSQPQGPDYLDDVKRQILDEVDRERKANEEKLKLLEAELYDLRVQVDTLDEEVRESARVREEIHDAIDNAASIDDIDRILRGGVPGVSGRHD